MSAQRRAILPRARLVALAAAGALLLVAASPASADSGEGIRSAKVVGDQLRLVVMSGTLQDQFDARQTGLTVQVDGRAVPARITAVANQRSTEAKRSAQLLVDTSGSMAGAGIAGAKQAATAFLTEVPADVLVGVTTFDSAVHSLVAPTTDRTALRRAVAGLQAGGETTLNDGILAALTSLGTTGTRRIVLLSDGADSRSRNGLPTAVAKLRASGVALSAVQFGADTSGNAALSALAAVSGGHPVRASDASTLAAAFTKAAHTFVVEIDVTATLPPGTAGRTVDVAVTLGSGRAAVAVVTRLAVPASRVPGLALVPGRRPTPPAGWFGSRASVPWSVAATFVGLLTFLLAMLGGLLPRASDSRRTRAVLARYTLLGRLSPQAPDESSPIANGAIARTALELTGRVTSRRGLEQRLRAKLERAALPVEPNEWVLLQFLLTLASVCVLFVLLSSLLIAVPAGLLLGVLGPKAVLSVRIGRRQRAFLDALPDSLQLMAGALSSGFSLPQALDTVVTEGAEPMAGEFGRALSESRIGVPVEQALEAVADRMQCEDFRWVVMAMRVQREVGGNLAGVLTTVSTTLRERARIRRQVRTLSAEGRLSAWILIALPVLLGLYQLAFRGSYFKPMYTTPAGVIMLVATAISMTVGAFWMKMLVKVEA